MNHSYHSQRNEAKRLKSSDEKLLKLSFNRQEFNKNFPNFQKPKILGDFSIDGSRAFCLNRSQLKFFDEERFKDAETGKFEKVELDLNAGLSKVVRKSSQSKDEKIDNMLRWILSNKHVLHNPNADKLESLPFDFVCYRGLLTTMMITLYDSSNDWEIHAIKIRGTIYLCAKETDAKLEREATMDPKPSSWGYKFEQYMQTDLPTKEKAKSHSERDESKHEPVNENEEFCCVFKSRLGSNSLLYGAEMDGFKMADASKRCDVAALDLSNDGVFVELKTSRLIENDRQWNSFCRFKTQKWWAQSFMVGIPNVYCGFRDDDGIVCQIQEYKTEALPKLAENRFWFPNVCMNFLNELLDFIKSAVELEERVYKFKCPVRSHGVIVEMDRCNDPGFLPDWYLNKVFEQGEEKS